VASSIFVISTSSSGSTHGARLVDYLDVNGDSVNTGAMGVTGSTTGANMDTFWGSGYGIIVVDYTINNGTHSAILTWVKGKFDAGTPVLFTGAFSAVNVGSALGLTASTFNSRYDPSDNILNMTHAGSHAIVSGLSSPYSIHTADNYFYDISSASFGTQLGTAVANQGNGTNILHVWAVGDSKVSGNAAARAVFFGALDYQFGALTSSGITLLGRILTWLAPVPAATTVVVAAALPSLSAATAGLTTIPAAVGATLPALSASAAATSTVTGAASATLPSLTAAVGVTADDTVPASVAATLPAMSASAAAVTTYTGAVAATLPSLSALLAADVETPIGDVIALDVGVDLIVLSQESQTPIVETDGLVLLDVGVDLVVRHQLTPATPPLGVLNEWPIRRQAHLMPALTAVNPRYRLGDYEIEYADHGRFAVFVDGVDVTYLRDSPLRFDDVTNSVQVGPLSASLTVPQMRPWDIPGEDDLFMFDADNDARVEVVMVREDDTLDYRFEGALATEEDSSGPGRESYTFHAEGALMQAAHEPHDVPLIQQPIDPGWLIADVLNSVTHRRYMKVRRFTTGMPKVTDRGQQGQSKWQRVLDLLTKCIDDDGRQLSLVRVGPWDFQMTWKQDTTTWDYTFTKGAPGVELTIRRDQSTRRDAIYGRGVDPEGGVWGNYFFPGLDFARPPLYPNNDFSNITVGTTDADTSTGNGVTLAEQRMRDLGFPVTPDGVWSSRDNSFIGEFQRKAGITVDDSFGPQTWSAVFDKGADSTFDIVRRPLAGLSSVEPLLYNANGSVAGPNPADNPKKIRHAMPESDLGLNIWKKREGIPLAGKYLARDSVAAYVVTMTLTSDPHEPGTSRFDIKPGDNLRLLGHHGYIIVQVAEHSHDDVTVMLTADSKARDALALDAILERDRDARRDPTGRTARTTDMSSLNKSEVVQYESESQAGFYPRTAINGNSGLWTVLPMFVSQVGVAKVEFQASGPKAEMVVALFEKPITANRLASFIPDPLSSKEGWYDNVEVLEARHGMTEIFGTPESPFGYWPRQKGDGPLTGKGKDRASTLYSSKYGGIMWVAVFTSVSTWVEGRCFPANGR
jgi:hypothetical protein